MSFIKSLQVPTEPDLAFAVAISLRKEADKIERQAVKNALKEGWSWSQIAQALGISKQAAHKRHARHVKEGDYS